MSGLPLGPLERFRDLIVNAVNQPRPKAGSLRVFAKSDGLYVRLADGTVSGPLAPAGAATSLQAGSYKRSTGNYTTSSASFVDIDATNAAFTFTTGARRVLLGMTGSCLINNAAARAGFDVLIDGTRYASTSVFGIYYFDQHATASEAFPIGFTILTPVLSAASHTFKFQWRVGDAAHTATLYGLDAAGVNAHFWALEVLA